MPRADGTRAFTRGGCLSPVPSVESSPGCRRRGVGHGRSAHPRARRRARVAVARCWPSTAACPGRAGVPGRRRVFVLSGFLITSLLVASGSGPEGWRSALLGRRARGCSRRCCWSSACSRWRRRAAPGREVALLRGDGLAALFYVANWRMIMRGGDYFAQTAAPSPSSTRGRSRSRSSSTWCGRCSWRSWLARRRHANHRRCAPCTGVCVLVPLRPGSCSPATTHGPRPGLLRDRHPRGEPAHRCRPRGRARAAPAAARGMRPSGGAPGARLATGACWSLPGPGPTRRRRQRLYRGGWPGSRWPWSVVLAHVRDASGLAGSAACPRPAGRSSGGSRTASYLWHWPVFIAVSAGRTGTPGCRAVRGALPDHPRAGDALLRAGRAARPEPRCRVASPRPPPSRVLAGRGECRCRRVVTLVLVTTAAQVTALRHGWPRAPVGLAQRRHQRGRGADHRRGARPRARVPPPARQATGSSRDHHPRPGRRRSSPFRGLDRVDAGVGAAEPPGPRRARPHDAGLRRGRTRAVPVLRSALRGRLA